MSIGARSPRRSLTIVSHRISHHAAHSGYDSVVAPLVDAIPGTRWVAWGDVRSALPARVLHRAARLNAASWYTADALAAELHVTPELVRSREAVVHFLYGDDEYFSTGFWPRRGRVVATFHQPPASFADSGPSRRSIQRLDDVVVVGSNQLDYFSEMLGGEAVHHVPHGVDVDFFSPAANGHETPRSQGVCLFVGQWLRDAETLSRVVRDLRSTRPSVKVRAVTTDAVRSVIGDTPNVTYLHGLDDDELRREYRAADVLLMPLKDCTANCAVVEALACGLPVVATDVGGIRDYVDDSCGVLVPPRDAAAMTEAALALLDDETDRIALAEGARQRGLELDWRLIVRRLTQVYSRIGRT